MDKELDKIINHIKDMNGNSSDINVRYFNIHKEKVAFMFLESVASDDKISNFLGKSLSINVRSKKIYLKIYSIVLIILFLIVKLR